MERERAHWERGREEWIGENRREEEEGEGRRKVGQIVGNEWSQDKQTKRAWALGVSQQFVLPRWLSLEAQKRSVMFRACLPSPYVWLRPGTSWITTCASFGPWVCNRD